MVVKREAHAEERGAESRSEDTVIFEESAVIQTCEMLVRGERMGEANQLGARCFRRSGEKSARTRT